jgi:hypothetical protein
LQAKRVIEKRSKLKTPGEGIPESKAHVLKYPVSLQTTALIYSSNTTNQDRKRSKSAGVKPSRKVSRPQTAKQRPQSSATVLKLFESAKRDYKQGQWKRAQDGLKDLLDKVSKQGGQEVKTRFVAKPYNRPKSARPTRHSAFPVSSAFSECDSEGEMDLVSDQELEKIFGEDVAREVVAKSTVIGLDKKKEKLNSRPQSRASTRPSSPIKKPVTIPQPQPSVQQEVRKVVPEKNSSKKRPVSAKKQNPLVSAAAKENQLPEVQTNVSNREITATISADPPQAQKDVPIPPSSNSSGSPNGTKEEPQKELEQVVEPIASVSEVQESLVNEENGQPAEAPELASAVIDIVEYVPEELVDEKIMEPSNDSHQGLEETLPLEIVQPDYSEPNVDQQESYKDDFDQQVEEEPAETMETIPPKSVENVEEQKDTLPDVTKSSRSISSSVPDLTKSNHGSQPLLSSRAELSKSSNSLSRSQGKLESKSKSNSANRLSSQRVLSAKPSQERLTEKKDSRSTTSLNQLGKAKSHQSLREPASGSARNSSSSLANKVQPIQYTFDSNGISKTVQGIYGDGSRKGSVKGSTLLMQI